MTLQLNKILHARQLIERFVATDRARSVTMQTLAFKRRLHCGTLTNNFLGVAPTQRICHALEEQNVLLERMRALAHTVPLLKEATTSGSQTQRLKEAIAALQHNTHAASRFEYVARPALQFAVQEPTQPIKRPASLLDWSSDKLDSDQPRANLAEANRAFEQAKAAAIGFTRRCKDSFRAQSLMISLPWSQAMLQ